jgi:DNA-binding NarL/FixJ family response regulator
MKTIVIIDDDLNLAEILSEKIKFIKGYNCIGIFPGPTSYLANNLKADYILLDILMPDMSGLDAIPLIIERFPETNILIQTSVDDTDALFTGLKLGAIGYIYKGSTQSELAEIFEITQAGGAFISPNIARKMAEFYHSTRTLTESVTSREKDIIDGILEGYSYKMIGDKYAISIDTVRSHIRNLYQKLSINSKAELFNLMRK